MPLRVRVSAAFWEGLPKMDTDMPESWTSPPSANDGRNGFPRRQGRKFCSATGAIRVRENKSTSGIQFVTDDKGRKVGVLIDLKKHGAIREDFWDGLVSSNRRKRNWMRSTRRDSPGSIVRFWRWRTTHGPQDAKAEGLQKSMAHSDRRLACTIHHRRRGEAHYRHTRCAPSRTIARLTTKEWCGKIKKGRQCYRRRETR